MARPPADDLERWRSVILHAIAGGLAALILFGLVYDDHADGAVGHQGGCNVALYQAGGTSVELYRGSTPWAGPFDAEGGSIGFGPLTGFALPSGTYRAVWDSGAVDRFTIDCPAPSRSPSARQLPTPTMPPTDTAG